MAGEWDVVGEEPAAGDDPWAVVSEAPAPRRGSSPGARMVERIGGWDLPDEMPAPDLAPPTPLDRPFFDPGPLGRIDTFTTRGGPTVRLPVPADMEARPPPEMPDPAEFTRPQPRDYEGLSTGQRAGDQLRSGVETLRQGLSSLGLGGLYDELDRLGRFEAGGLPAQEAARSPVPFASMTPEQRAAYRARVEESAGRRLASIVASRQRQQLLASNPRAREMVEALNAGRWGDGWRSFIADPGGIIQQFAVESLPTSAGMMAAGLAGGALGGPGVGAASAFLSSAGLDFGPRTVEILMDGLRERGVDVNDERAVAAYLRTDPTLARDAARQAGFGAGAMATFDAAGLGAAGGIRRGAGLGANTRAVGRNLGIELASEPAGEAAAQLASTGELKPGELAAELLGAGPQVVGTTAYGTLMEARNPAAPERPVTDSAPLPAEPYGPSAPPVMGPLGQILAAPEVPVQSLPGSETPAPPIPTEPPAAAGPSPGASAQPPAGAPANYAGVPPSAAVAAPPGAPTPPPSSPPAAPGAAAVSPAAPAVGPPAGVGETQPAVPPLLAPPPPQPNVARASLEAALAAPTPAAQAAQAAERAARIQAIQAGLPPGWSVVDEDGAISVLDPNQLWQEQFDDPPADPTRTIEDARRAHEEGVRSGLYPNAADAAAAETNPAPTPAQAAAGNYAKGRVRLHGLDISIETPRGAERTGVGRAGRPWSVTMPAHYGYVRGSTGADGDQVDVYLGPRAEDAEAPVFVVDQIDAETGRFDEHKALLGVGTEAEALALYDAGFSDGRGPQRRVAVTRMSLAEFKAWLAAGNTRAPLNRQAISDGLRARRAEKHRQRLAKQAASQPSAPASQSARERLIAYVQADGPVREQKPLRDVLAALPGLSAAERMIADRVAAIAGDTPVLIVDGTEHLPRDNPGQFRRARDDRTEGIILLRSDASTETTLHEGVHAATATRIDEDADLGARLHRLGIFIHERLRDDPEAGVPEPRLARLAQANEMVAYGLTDLALQRAMARLPLDAETAKRLRVAGARNAWQAFVDALRRALGLPRTALSVLDAVAALADEAMGGEATRPPAPDVTPPAPPPQESAPSAPADVTPPATPRERLLAGLAKSRAAATAAGREVPAQAPTPKRRRKAARPRSLLAFLAASGGLHDGGFGAGGFGAGGDVRYIFGGRNPVIPGRGRLIRKNGLALDRALELAIQDDYLRDGATVQDLLEAIDEEARGRPQRTQTERAERDIARDESAAETEREQIDDIVRALEGLVEQHRMNATPADIQKAAETAFAEGTDPLDALVDVIERNAIVAADTHERIAPDASEWDIPWDATEAAAPDAGGPEAPSAAPAPERERAAGPDGGAAEGGPPAGVEPGPSDRGAGDAPAPETATERVQTLDGERDQFLIPGVAPVTDRDRLAVQADKPLRGGNAPPPAGGLFDEGATQQTDLVEAVRNATRAGDGQATLYSTPFDPAAFRRFFLDPAMTAFRAAAEKVREADLKAVRKLWPASTLPPEITVDASGRASGPPGGAVRHLLRISGLGLPARNFRQWPELAALIDKGARAEARISKWNTRMGARFDAILADLKKAKGDLPKVWTSLLDAEANEVDIEKAATAAAHWEVHGLSPVEARAAAEMNRLLVQVARLVDQHRRAMQPKVRAAKAKVWAAMQKIADKASVPGADYAALYRRRTTLNARIRAGKGDLAAQGREVAEINNKLKQLRAADPALQERLKELQAEYDALEARLQESSVRRRKGYFPHKFFGSWRLFEIGEPDPETGEPTRIEITSDQGFFDTLGDATAAAKAHLAENPGATLRIEPRMVAFPAMGGGGAVLSDAAYFRLRRGLEKSAGLEGNELNEALSGVARRRGRRRVFSPSLLRKGAEGFAGSEILEADDDTDVAEQSRLLERVMRTHIAQATRYVEMDKMKHAYVETTEALGLSPGRATAVRLEGMEDVQRDLESWFRDLNGNPQPSEEMVDSLIRKSGLPISTIAAGAIGFVAGGGFANPILAPALAGYFGLRMSRAIRKGGDFPTRTLMNGATSDQAHLKLGAVFNITSAISNLTQTALATYPVLGERWTAVGIKRALAAFRSQELNADAPNRASLDAILLTRADVRTKFRFADDGNSLLVKDDTLVERAKNISMLAFTSAETFNRAVAFLGAYARAEAQGKSPAEAMREAEDIIRKTQFHHGMADRPAVLRNQLLRVPSQFKNFVAQMTGLYIGFVAEGKTKPGQLIRAAVMMMLVAGLFGFFGLQFADWLTKLLTGAQWSLVTWLKEQVILAGAEGWLSGTAADVLSRGLPALLGVDMSGRTGMGISFLPDEPRDAAGPLLSTVDRLRNLARNEAQLTDYLMVLGPFAAPLRALEAAANGAGITSRRFWDWTGPESPWGDGQARLTNPGRRDQTEFRPTNAELLATGLGARPLRQALQSDQREVQRHEMQDRTRDHNAYLARIIQARWDGRMEAELPKIVEEAARNGVNLTQRQIVEAIRNAEMERAERDLKRAPRELRPGVLQRQQAIEERFQPAR